MKPKQLAFELPPARPAMGRDDFFVSSANQSAVALVDGWRDWSAGKLVLTGDLGAGKTHLAHVWATQTDARIIAARDVADLPLDALPPALAVEDVDQIAGDAAAEEVLFHLHNALSQIGAPLLLTARSAPSRWGLTLPDLASRMAQASLARLDPPDDQLLIVLMMKHAADRKLDLTPNMLQHIAARLPRSFAAADRVVARIDVHALAARKPANMTHVRAALADIEDDPSF